MYAHIEKKMKICLLGDSSSVHFQKWATYFVGREYEVHCISCSCKNISGATMYHVGYGFGKLDYILAILSILKIVKKVKPKVVHVHYLSGYGMLALPLAMGDVPLIGTAWGSDILLSPQESLFVRVVVKAVLKWFSHLIAVSAKLEEEMIKLGADRNKISVLPIGVDTKFFIPLENKRKETFQIISLNAHEPIYNTCAIIQAINEIVKQGYKIKAVIVGQGSETEMLKSKVAEFGLQDYIIFPGRVQIQELLNIMQNSTVYVSMAKSAGTPVSLLEAMACGVFPIVTDIRGHNDWIRSGDNGILVQKDSVPLLVNSLLEAINNNVDMQAAAFYNRSLVLQKADWDCCMLEAEEIYHNIMKRE